MPVPLNIPRQIVAGCSYTWSDRFIDYKPLDYSLSWAIRGASALNLISASFGDEFQTTLLPIGSSALSPGRYYFQAIVSDSSGGKFYLGAGELEVLANFESIISPYDGSTTAQKLLSLVETAIKARLEGGAVDSYEIRGRNLSRTPLPDLVKLRDRLKIEVARERSALGLMPDSRRLWVRFGGHG